MTLIIRFIVVNVVMWNAGDLTPREHVQQH